MLMKKSVSHKNHAAPGFTIVELLVTLAIIGITAAIVLPQMGLFTSGNRMTEQINKLSRDLNYARSEAITRGTPVQVLSNNGTNWADGWVINDLGNNAVTLLRQTGSNTQPIAKGTTTLVETTNGGTAGDITFRPDGRVLNAATFLLCDSGNTNYGKQIIISLAGRLEINSNKDRSGATFC